MAYYKAMADNTVDDVIRWQDHVASRGDYRWLNYSGISDIQVENYDEGQGQ